MLKRNIGIINKYKSGISIFDDFEYLSKTTTGIRKEKMTKIT